MVVLKVNGLIHHLEVDPDTPLLWVLRDQLGFSGAKYCCGIGECGACTVHLNDDAVMSCTVTAIDAEGFDITTIEGLKGRAAESLFEAWRLEGVPQCGYCQPGQIMTAAALLYQNSRPSEKDIKKAMSGVLCRCGTYQRIRSAIERAVGEVSGE